MRFLNKDFMGKKAIIAGASGLVGGHLLDMLLNEDSYSDVLVIARRKINRVHPKLSQLTIDFDRMSDYASSITGDVIFCCLGSTRKKTPDKTLYYKIEHDYSLQLATIGLRNKTVQFHFISAIGANAHSMNFYSKMKGEASLDISKLDYPSLYIYEPSLLTGDRKESRTGEQFFEKVMKYINPMLIGSWKKYRSVPAVAVARALIEQSLHARPGKFLVRFTGQPEVQAFVRP